jgi:hypothetical protein
MSEKERHIVEYSVLILVSVLVLFLFYFIRYENTFLIILSGFASAFYVIWGIVHHALESRLTKSIAFEYSLFGVLVFLLLFSALSK